MPLSGRRTGGRSARSLRDRHVVVTGGSSGIGLALVGRLAGRGARVSVMALDDGDLVRLRAQPPAGERAPHLVPVDVVDPRAVRAGIGDCVAANGPVDAMVTCAGVALPGYFGTLWSIRAVAPSMVQRRTGTIVLVSSFAGLVGVFGYGAYGPPKFAVRGLAETLRLELGPHGIHVACVFPPDVDTPQLAYEQPLKPPETRAMSATMAVIQPEVVADAILAGMASGRARIYPGRTTGFLARLAGACPGLSELVSSRAVARAQSRR